MHVSSRLDPGLPCGLNIHPLIRLRGLNAELQAWKRRVPPKCGLGDVRARGELNRLIRIVSMFPRSEMQLLKQLCEMGASRGCKATRHPWLGETELQLFDNEVGMRQGHPSSCP
jgi:hypothetical protein